MREGDDLAENGLHNSLGARCSDGAQHPMREWHGIS
jgi:hypothetical protein